MSFLGHTVKLSDFEGDFDAVRDYARQLFAAGGRIQYGTLGRGFVLVNITADRSQNILGMQAKYVPQEQMESGLERICGAMVRGYKPEREAVMVFVNLDGTFTQVQASIEPILALH
jgi:hypothetical protein